MKITALAAWFGSKRSMAPIIHDVAGPHRCWWDICFGSAAVTLSKPKCANETLVDLHGDVTNLAWVCQHDNWAAQLFDRLQRTLPCEDLFRESNAVCCTPWNHPTPSVDRAYHYVVSSWLGRSGMAGTARDKSQIAVRWTANGGSPAARFKSAVQSVPDWHARLADVLILRRDIYDVLPAIEDEEGTVIYCDPPYLKSTRTSNPRGGGAYLFDFDDAHHVRLAKELGRFRKAKVIVSYYKSPEVEKLYKGWTVIDCTRRKALSHQHRRGAKTQVAPEILLTNRKDANLFSGAL